MRRIELKTLFLNGPELREAYKTAMSKLFPCKSCGRSISYSANACPGCGHDVKKDRDDNQKFKELLLWVGGLLIVVILLKIGFLDWLIQQIPFLKTLKPQN